MPTVAGAHARFLGLDEHGVHVADFDRRVTDMEHTRDVGAIAVHRPAEVAQDEVAGRDRARRSGLVVRARRVRTGGDDREVGALVPGREHAVDELAVHLQLGAPRKLDRTHIACDRVDRVRGPGQGRDLVVVLDHPDGRHHRGRAREHTRRNRALEIEEEPRPRVVTDRDPPGRAPDHSRNRTRPGRRSPPT